MFAFFFKEARQHGHITRQRVKCLPSSSRKLGSTGTSHGNGLNKDQAASIYMQNGIQLLLTPSAKKNSPDKVPTPYLYSI
jgi:hypothetical protein